MSEIVTAGILVIGDEILSGRTKDKNIGFIAEYLTNIGIDLKEVRVVADDEAVALEPLEGVAHGDTADAEFLRQRPLDEAGAAAELATQDAVPQQFVDLGSERLAAQAHQISPPIGAGSMATALQPHGDDKPADGRRRS